MVNENNVLKLPVRVIRPSILEAVIACLNKFPGHVVKKQNYTLSGAYSSFDFNGRHYEMVVRDLGPAPQGKEPA